MFSLVAGDFVGVSVRRAAMGRAAMARGEKMKAISPALRDTLTCEEKNIIAESFLRAPLQRR